MSAPARVAVHSTPDLAATVPHLLGFAPTSSVVVLNLADSGRVGMTGRADLAALAALPFPAELQHSPGDTVPDCSDLCAGVAPSGYPCRCSCHRRRSVAARPGDPAAAARARVRPMFNSGRAFVIAYCEPAEVATATAAALAVGSVGARQGVELLDIAVVCSGRVLPVLCADPACCSPAPLPSAPAAVAAAVVSGSAPLLSRSAVVQSLAPRRDRIAREFLADLATLTGADILTAAVPLSTPGPAGATDRARTAVALRDIEYRDSVWQALDRAVTRPERALRAAADSADRWADLARDLPEPYSAAPYFLAGWAYWRGGDGARAQVCADLAGASAGGYPAAEILTDLLAIGLDPSTAPTLAALAATR